MAAIALVLGRDLAAAGQCPQRREDVRELGSDLIVEAARAAAGSRPATYWSSASTKTENGRSRSSSDGRPGKDEVPARLGASGELPEQARLADPGFADQLDRAGAAPVEVVEAARSTSA